MVVELHVVFLYLVSATACNVASVGYEDVLNVMQSLLDDTVNSSQVVPSCLSPLISVSSFVSLVARSS